MEGKSKHPPSEYIEYKLIKELYHCTPLELEKQQKHITDLHIAIMNMEAEWQWKQQKRSQQ